MSYNAGDTAGRIWKVLYERGRLSIRKIGEITSMSESSIFIGLGWLARENKVEFHKRSGMLYVELKY